MIARLRALRDDERGATLALVAVTVMSVTAMFALTFDLGLLRSAHNEAQSAADAGALGGASAFQDFNDVLVARPVAFQRAYDVATLNYINATPIDSADVTVEVDHEARQVYVKVERNDIPMWFARLFGINRGAVEASATAEASELGGVSCLRPLAIPDHWHDANNDINNDRIWDAGEDWEYDPADGDLYARFGSGSISPPETGFGSTYRNNYGTTFYDEDFGRVVMMKPQNPHQAPTSGFFYMLDFYDQGGGATDWATNLTTSCDSLPPAVYNVGDSLAIKPGVSVGPVAEAFERVIAMDDQAQWDPISRTIINSNQGTNWKASRRVLQVAVFDPNLIGTISGTSNPLFANNFAYYFVEGFRRNNGSICTSNCSAQDPVVGRFLYYGTGVGPGGTQGQLVLQLRLIR
jgi:hypothetical protein